MKKLIDKYPLLIIVAIAIVLRIPLINGSFWMDEAAQALEVIRPFNQQLDIIADFQPPLLHFILHFAQYFSYSEWYLRTIGALIPGIVTIIYTYKIAQKLFSNKVALISGLLLATSSFHIFFSQELRPYSLPTALALISMHYFIKITQNKSRIENNFFLNKFNFWHKESNDNFVFLTIFNALGLYASYLYPFFMIAEIAYTLYSCKLKKLKKLLTSFGISILTFVPFLPIFLKQLKAGGNVRNSLPGWDQVVSIPQLKALPLVFGKLVFGLLPLNLTPIIILFSILIGLSGLLVIYQLISNLNKFKNEKTILMMFWLLIPLFSAWLISFIVPVVRPKRLLFLLPSFYILVSYFSLNIKIKKPYFKNVNIIFLSSLFLLNIYGTTSYYIDSKLQREDWRSLHTQLHQVFIPAETLLVYSFPNEFSPMQWYELQNEFAGKETFPTYSTKVLYIEDIPDLSNSIKIAANYKTIIVFDYLRDLTDPNKKIEQQLTQLGFKEVGVLDYPNIGFVRIFSIPLNVIGLK
jgi:mannosyltransferase